MRWSVWIAATAVQSLYDSLRVRDALTGAGARWRAVPRARLGMSLAHAGVAVFVFGVTMVKGYEVGKGQHVLLEEQDLAAIPLKSLKSIDILEFVDSKALEEKKAWALIEQGYDPSFTGEAYGSVFFQNANHSVRVTDDFMRAVAEYRRAIREVYQTVFPG